MAVVVVRAALARTVRRRMVAALRIMLVLRMVAVVAVVGRVRRRGLGSLVGVVW